jgi:phage-related tail protein
VALITGAATAAAGLVGGVVLGKRFANKPKKVFGVPVPGTGRGLDGVAKQVKKAGKQVGKTSKQIAELTDEVRAARKKAEDVGKAIS